MQASQEGGHFKPSSEMPLIETYVRVYLIGNEIRVLVLCGRCWRRHTVAEVMQAAAVPGTRPLEINNIIVEKLIAR